MLLVGNLTYNGITFDGSSQVTLQTESVRDEADRLTIFVRHTLTVRAVLHYPGGTDGSMMLARQALEETGMRLTFTGQGAGNFDVNQGMIWDVKNGPKPRILAWAPIGSLLAAEVIWTCEFCLPLAATSTWISGGDNPILALNYAVAYVLDARGATTRTISGYLEVAQKLYGNTLDMKPFLTADAYRYKIAPPIPSEFKRTTQDFRLSLDKSRLDFTIVDEETASDNPYPTGVANIDAHHSVSWVRGDRGMGFLRNRLTCEIDLAFNQPIENAYAIFLLIAQDRLTKARAPGRFVMIEDVYAEEGLFDRHASFALTYRFTYDVSTLIYTELPSATGLFQPLAPVGVAWTWNNWASSLLTTADVDGYQQLTSSNNNDRAVNVCYGNSIPWGHSQSPIASGALMGSSSVGLTNTYPYPEPQYSWLDFCNWIEIVRDTPQARQSILQAPPAAESASGLDPDAVLTYPAATGMDDVIQKSGNPKYLAIIRGYAKRAGCNIPRPVYPTYGGANCHEIHSRFGQKILGKVLGLTVYLAVWEITYELDKSPGTVVNLPNNAEGVMS